MLANAIVVGSSPTTVTFTVPVTSDGGVSEPGGTYSIYTAPVFPDDPAVTVTRN